MRIDLADYQNIVVLTGAGVSVASGLPTYRGAGGLWEHEDGSRLATIEAWETNPDEVWRLFGPLRTRVAEAEPNAAHKSLARMEDMAPGAFTLITQNVDGLHQRAGSKTVIELHGSLRTSRCSNPNCTLAPFADDVPHIEAPDCPECSGRIRPHIVLFGEPLPGGPDHMAIRALRDCDLFIAVGTSGTVSPASRFVRSAEYVGARTVLVNLEDPEHGASSFQDRLHGRAEELLSEVFLP